MKKNYLPLIMIVASTTFFIGCSRMDSQVGSEKKDVATQAQVDSAYELPPYDSDNTRNEVEPAVKPSFQFYGLLGVSEERNSMVIGSVRNIDNNIPQEDVNRENYDHKDDNPIKQVAQQPVSTFSIDVDTGSYANVRRLLTSGQLPPKDSVRSEEMINYFDYAYPVPESATIPFSVTRELAQTPWNPNTLLLHIGLQGYDMPADQLPASNLVFLIDVSGSMRRPNKLELLKSSLKLLTNQLDTKDKVSIVVYAGASGVVLQPTAGNKKAQIIRALEQLKAGGSTNGADGIRLAYSLAEEAFIKDGINRVIIATDGDFNVGTVNHEQLIDLIEEKRKSGIALSTLGFGTGNYNDYLMEQLADHGNGNYAYIDNLNEAQKVLVDEMNSTLMTIAKDVKIQVEFNPALVSEYRLIGYENRQLKREDFSNDKVDAGEIGAGHTVTAIYEIALVGSKGNRIEELRYQPTTGTSIKSNELAHLRVRYKQPDSDKSQLLEWPITQDQQLTSLQDASDTFQFSAAVAGFAQQLRGGQYLEEFGYQQILELARIARGGDPFGYRGGFIQMVQLAQSLTSSHVSLQTGSSE